MLFNVRNYYTAEPGCILLDCDYSSQEYKLLGHYGNDASFMQFVHEGLDIHQATASQLFHVPYAEVTKDQRQKAKTFNFGAIYGLSTAAMANGLGYSIDEKRMRVGTKRLYATLRPWKLPPYDTTTYTSDYLVSLAQDDAERDGIEYFLSPDVQAALKATAEFKKAYFSRFPGNKQFLKDVADAAESRGWVKTWTGRRRHFKNPKEESYKAANACVQGGCGDICKVKLYALTQFLKPYKTRLVNTVHDSITFNMPYDELHLIPEIKRILEDLPFRVPIAAGVEWGLTWGETKEFESIEQIKKELGVV